MPKHPRTTDPKLVVAYVRVSTTDQPNSPAAQADSIQRFADRNGLRVVASFADRGVSGSKPAMDRHGFSSAIDALAQHGAASLLVAKRDRLGRDVVEVGLATRLVERLGARVLAADGTGNGEAPEDKLLCGIVDVFAQYERAIIRARTKAALRARRNRGLKFSRYAPFGSRWDRHGKIHPVPKQLETLKRMRVLRKRGLSFRAIGEKLDSEGRGPARAARWSIGMVASFVRRAQA